MATYVVLVNFTDQGVRYKQTTERAKGLVNAAANLGIKLKISIGPWAPTMPFLRRRLPDDETITAFAGSMGALGNIRTRP